MNRRDAAGRTGVAVAAEDARAANRAHEAKRRRRRLAIVLGAVAGGVDAIGYLTLFHLFTAHMTGNTVAMAVHAAARDWHEAVRRAAPLPLFVSGVVAGANLSKISARRGARARYAFALVLEALVLLAYMLIGPRVALGPDEAHTTPAYWALSALPAVAMGLQTATVRRIGDHSVRTTFVTGILTSFGEQLVEIGLLLRERERGGSHEQRRRSAIARARLVFSIWFAYALGAVGCAIAEAELGFDALVLPLGGIALAIVIDIRAGRLIPDEVD